MQSLRGLKFDKFNKFLESLNEKYAIKIRIIDYSGFTKKDKQLEEGLSPFLSEQHMEYCRMKCIQRSIYSREYLVGDILAYVVLKEGHLSTDEKNMIENAIGLMSEFIENILIIISKDSLRFTDTKLNTEYFVVKRIVEYIKQNYRNKVTLADLAASCGCSKSYISHIFKSNFRCNLNEYVNKIRSEASKELLINTQLKIVDIALDVGFESSSQFSSAFKRFNGINPYEYRKMQR